MFLALRRSCRFADETVMSARVPERTESLSAPYQPRRNRGTAFAEDGPSPQQEVSMLWLVAILFGGVAFAFVKIRRRRKAGAMAQQ